MTREQLKQAIELDKKIENIKRSKQRIRDTEPHLTASSGLILTNTELKKLGVIEVINQKLDEAIKELEEEFIKL